MANQPGYSGRPPQSSPASPWKALTSFLGHRGLKWVVSVGVALAALFVLFVTFRMYGFLKQFDKAIDLLSGRYGVNSWLAKALALVLVSPLAWGFKRGFLTTGSRRPATRLFTVAYACAYFLVMYAVSRSVRFSHETGEALQWCGSTPEGERCFDSPGYDPKYGIKLRPATSDAALARARRIHGQLPKAVPLKTLSELELFDPLTGESRYWYSQAPGGSYELFDAPGFHPQVGAPLHQVTRAVVEKIGSWQETREAATRDAEAQRLAAESTHAHLAFVDRYIDRNVRRFPRVTQWSILLIGPKDGEVPELAYGVTGALESRGLHLVPLFRPTVVADGIADTLYSGSSSLSRRLKLGEFCDRILIVRTRLKVSRAPELQDLFTAELRLDARIIAASTGAIEQSFHIVERGAGFSQDRARSQAASRAAQSLSVKVAEVAH